MGVTSIGLILSILLIGEVINPVKSIRCYECIARLGPGDTSPCLTGDRTQLRRVHCIGPSVCATYRYETAIPGTPPINHVTRGCQAIRYGATCEDIFNALRARNEIHPGQHTCTTCSSDLCNSAGKIRTVLETVLSLVLVGIFRLIV